MTTQLQRTLTAPNGECVINIWTFESDDDRRTWSNGQYMTHGRGHVIIVEDDVSGSYDWHEYPYDSKDAKERTIKLYDMATERGWDKVVTLY